MFDTTHDPDTAATVAEIAARNKFGAAADLSDPAIRAWMKDFAEGWAEGVSRVRDGLDQIFREPNAWHHREFVLAAYIDAGVDASTVIATLRALPTRSAGAGNG